MLIFFNIIWNTLNKMKVTNELDQIVGYFYQIKELKRQEKVSYLFQINVVSSMELK